MSKTKINCIALVCLVTLGISCNTTKKATKNKPQNQITEKYWKLIQLKGQTVTMAQNQERERYFMLKTKDNRVKGFAGCNSFHGSYTIEKENRIHFAHMLSTLKACPQVKVNESKFLKVFGETKTYRSNAKTLTLMDENQKPLAVFKVVYFN